VFARSLVVWIIEYSLELLKIQALRANLIYPKKCSQLEVCHPILWMVPILTYFGRVPEPVMKFGRCLHCPIVQILGTFRSKFAVSIEGKLIM
jgi:hypothetical protein